MNGLVRRLRFLVVGLVAILVVAAGTIGARTVPVASAADDVDVEFRVEQRSGDVYDFAITVRNNRLTNIGGVSVLGRLPYGAELLNSWTGSAQDQNPGRIVDDWVGWINAEVLAESFQGPFWYRVRITPGYTLEFYARATWIGPGAGEVWSDPITVAGPELPPEQPKPTPVPQTLSTRTYKYRVSHTQVDADCSHTRLFGTVEDGNGLLVKTWNDWGNESISMVGLDRQEGTWERYVGPGSRPGVWHAQVLDPISKGPISPVSTVEFIGTKGCEEKGAIQSIWIHFKKN